MKLHGTFHGSSTAVPRHSTAVPRHSTAVPRQFHGTGGRLHSRPESVSHDRMKKRTRPGCVPGPLLLPFWETAHPNGTHGTTHGTHGTTNGQLHGHTGTRADARAGTARTARTGHTRAHARDTRAHLAGETSAGETSAGGTSAGETSAGETSAGETSAGGTPGNPPPIAFLPRGPRFPREVPPSKCLVGVDW
eukprot:gene11125-biopygen4834